MLADELADMLLSARDPQQRATVQAVARAEYSNLTAAMAHGLRTGQRIDALIQALDTYLRQSQQHETRRQLLDDAIAAYTDPAGHARESRGADENDGLDQALRLYAAGL